VGKAVDPPAKGRYALSCHNATISTCSPVPIICEEPPASWRMLRPVRRSRTIKFCRSDAAPEAEPAQRMPTQLHSARRLPAPAYHASLARTDGSDGQRKGASSYTISRDTAPRVIDLNWVLIPPPATRQPTLPRHHLNSSSEAQVRRAYLGSHAIIAMRRLKPSRSSTSCASASTGSGPRPVSR
jgi:hypothetical protein